MKTTRLTAARPLRLLACAAALLSPRWLPPATADVAVTPIPVDERFGTTGRDSDGGLGSRQLGMTTYHDYNASWLYEPPAGMTKHWVVGKIDARKDYEQLQVAAINDAFKGYGGFGTAWHLLDVLALDPQDTSNALDALAEETIRPILQAAWSKAAPVIESKCKYQNALLKKVYIGTIPIVFRFNSSVDLPDNLPSFALHFTRQGGEYRIDFSSTIPATYALHVYVSKATFPTKATASGSVTGTLSGQILLKEDGGRRYLQFHEPKISLVGTVAAAQGTIDYHVGKATFDLRSSLQPQVDTAVANAEAAANSLLRTTDLNGNRTYDVVERFYVDDLISAALFGGAPLPTQRKILDDIFHREAPEIQRLVEKGGHVGEVWEIGNEPNWYPYIDPSLYAYQFSRYFYHIKNLDPTARVMNGGLLTHELIQNPSQFIQQRFNVQVGGFPLAFSALVDSTLTALGTRGWYERFHDALPADVAVDIGNFHAYPAATGGFVNWADARATMDATATFLRGRGAGEVWVTEFGNTDFQITEADCTAMVKPFVDYFRGNSVGITRWIWFRAPGNFIYPIGGFAPPTELYKKEDQKELSLVGAAYQAEYAGVRSYFAERVASSGAPFEASHRCAAVFPDVPRWLAGKYEHHVNRALTPPPRFRVERSEATTAAVAIEFATNRDVFASPSLRNATNYCVADMAVAIASFDTAMPRSFWENAIIEEQRIYFRLRVGNDRTFADADSQDAPYLVVVPFGDCNLDGTVDQTDYSAVRQSMGSRAADPHFNSNADFDGDGAITHNDYFIWHGYYRSATGQTPVLANGGFEEGTAGWQATGNVDVKSGGPYVAVEGTRLAAFNSGDTAPDGELATTFATEPGQVYRLAFLAGTLSYASGPQMLDVSVTSNTPLLSKTLSIMGTGGGKPEWMAEADYFIADGLATTLRFRDVSQATRNLDLLLDNVSVIPAPRPVIYEQPASREAAPGDSVTFRVGVEPPGLRLQWRFNGDPIPGANGESLTLAGVTAEDDGLYDVVLSDFYSFVVSEPATLSVLAPPFANGGFESGLDGWMTSGNVRATQASLYAPTEGDTAANFNAGDTTPDGFLSRTFATLPGQTYLLTFDMGVLSYVRYSSQRLEVGVTGTDLPADDVFAMAGDGSGVPRWETKGLLFVSTRHSVTLTFRDVSSDTFSIDLMLDRVEVRPVEEGFAWIPAGEFQMGDVTGDGESWERPVHRVFVSDFDIGTHEVTKLLWDQIRAWGMRHGYRDLPPGLAKGPDHPVHTVTWHAAVKWCNARSEMNGLTPAYSVAGAVYRKGESDLVLCDFAADGFRLPTEAEWEKAARGGMSGMRFPNGKSISHDMANYYSDTFNASERARYFYDLSPVAGYHPEWAAGSYPYTSPAGSFDANGHGLFDTAGNVFEFCWDSYGLYSPAAEVDPTGPPASAWKIIRGGAWDSGAFECRAAFRNGWDSRVAESDKGFRLARTRQP